MEDGGGREEGGGRREEGGGRREGGGLKMLLSMFLSCVQMWMSVEEGSTTAVLQSTV